MNANYKQTFDAVRMSPEHQAQIRSVLSSRSSETHKENKIMPVQPRPAKRLAVAGIAAVFVLALLTTTGIAYGNQIIQLLGGGQIESGRIGKDHYTSITITEGSHPAEVRAGRVYFVLDGSDTDITSYCTEATYYVYEHVAVNGYRHVMVVGGAPDKLGWAEFIWDEDGNKAGSTAVFYPDSNDERPEWLRLAEETF